MIIKLLFKSRRGQYLNIFGAHNCYKKTIAVVTCGTLSRKSAPPTNMSQESWVEIIRNLPIEGDFEYGPEPTLEKFTETQVRLSCFRPVKDDRQVERATSYLDCNKFVASRV